MGQWWGRLHKANYVVAVAAGIHVYWYQQMRDVSSPERHAPPLLTSVACGAGCERDRGVLLPAGVGAAAGGASVCGRASLLCKEEAPAAAAAPGLT